MAFILIISILISIFIKTKSLDILEKYGSAKISSSIIFECKDFKIGKEMYFTITSSGNIENLNYQYYDNINSLDYKSEAKYEAQSLSEDLSPTSTTTVFGVVVSQSHSSTKRFSIKKKKEEIGDYSGNYMLLKIKGSGTIENSRFGISTSTIVVIAVIGVVSLAAMIVIIVCFILQKIKEKKGNNEVKDGDGVNPGEENNNNNSVYSREQMNQKSGQKTIIYQNRNNNNQGKINLISQNSNENENEKKSKKKKK